MYTYAILKESYPELERESTYLYNNYKPNKKYALIEKQVFKDGSEGVNRIIYSNDLNKMTTIVETYKSWYNYPKQLTKSLNQYVCKLF